MRDAEHAFMDDLDRFDERERRQRFLRRMEHKLHAKERLAWRGWQ